MGYYIIIRGPLGIGKSTIARRLAGLLNGEYVSIDKILEKHGLDKVSKDVGCVPVENFIKADEIIFPEINKKLKDGKIIIFDACFYHKKHIEHIIKNLHYPHYVFTLKAPLEICIDRDSKRDKTYGKDAAMAVHKLVSRFDYGTIINTKGKTTDQTVEEINSYLSK